MSDEKQELPEYLKQNEDGSVDVQLRRVINVNGARVSAMRMREPSVEDQLVMQAVKGSDEVQELTFFANLCEVTLQDIKSLKLHDYKRLQRALGFMIA